MFPGKEHAFEPVDVVRGNLTATHDVFEDEAVVAPGIFEQTRAKEKQVFILPSAAENQLR